MFSFLLIAVMSCSSYAGDSGFYGGVKILDSYQSTGNISTSGSGSLVDAKDYSQNTLGAGIFFGYDFYLRSGTPIRAEIEYALRSNVNTSYDAKGGRSIGGSRLIGGSIKHEYNMQTFFANAYYDFRNSTDFTPYVGGGLGLALINSKIEGEWVAANGSQGSDSYTSTDWALAYNLGLGCSYAITDKVSADLAYRFVGTSYHETDKSIAGQKTNIGMSNYANEFSLGLRYSF